MNYWLLKTEPSTYSHADLVRDKRTTWDGVANPVALRNMGGMTKGDEVMIYHTGDEKQIVGLARVAGAPYADPKQSDPRMLVVDLVPGPVVAHPVTLKALKADARFKDFALVRLSRLSVMPVTPAQWNMLLEMSKG